MSILSHAYKLLDELDLEVLRDIKDEEGTPCFYVGRPSELDAGIRGQSISPCLSTYEDVIDWVNANEKELRNRRFKTL